MGVPAACAPHAHGAHRPEIQEPGRNVDLSTPSYLSFDASAAHPSLSLLINSRLELLLLELRIEELSPLSLPVRAQQLAPSKSVIGPAARTHSSRISLSRRDARPMSTPQQTTARLGIISDPPTIRVVDGNS